MHGQIGMSFSGNSGLYMMHNEGNVGYGVIVATKQDMGSGDSSDGRGGDRDSGIPNFAEVYSFIESVFDPNSIARLV
ncbi:hypothetical protein GIB67_001992 [Kingdonia uniflora]|uniref:Uncharacterized protein n=1 Tax=Kingdonia uniflora TaxID=39325 RepID=A0A7J7MA02_9MAGN|nr:hypothetical protein GIB67_001992 [Kingdonia uniflora]